MKFTQEHEEIRRTLKRVIDNEINPHVDEWEAAEQFPAHQVFRKLGDLGLLGLSPQVLRALAQGGGHFAGSHLRPVQ